MKRKFSTISPSKFYGSKRFKPSGGQVVNKDFAKLSRNLDRAMAKRVRGSPKRRAGKRGRGSFKSRPITSPHHGVSFTRSTVVYRNRNAIVKKLTQPSLLKSLFPEALTSLWNKQGVRVMGESYNSRAFMQLIFSYAAKLLVPTLVSTAPYMNDDQSSFKLFIDKTEHNYVITNQAPTDCEIEIYDLVCKNTASVYQNPIALWEAGISHSDQTPDSTQSATFCRSKPFESKEFNIHWKVVKKHTINISPGRSHDHTFSMKVNRMIDTSYFYANGMVKGITSCSMYVTRGALGDSTNTDAIGTVGFTVAKCVIVGESRWTVRLLNEHPRIYTTLSSLIATEPANVWTQDEGSGAPQNIGPAFRTTYA